MTARADGETAVHWVGQPGEGPTSLHGNGDASFARTSGDEDEVTCSLCLSLLAARTPADDAGDVALVIAGVEYTVADLHRVLHERDTAENQRDEARAEVDSLRAEVERLRKWRERIADATGLSEVIEGHGRVIHDASDSAVAMIREQFEAALHHANCENEFDSLRVTLAAVSSALAYIRYLIENASDEEMSALTEQIDWHASRALIPTDPVSLADVWEPDADDDLTEWLETVLSAMVAEAERATTPEQAFHIAIRAVHAVRRIRFPVNRGYYGAFKSRMAIERVSGVHLGDYPERAIIDPDDDHEAVTSNG